MKIDKKQKTLLAATIIALLVITGVTIAVTIITAPEHITGNPIPKPEPTETPDTTVTLSLTSNNTSPFYINDTLSMTATLTPAFSGINVTLYNNGVIVTSALTNSNGVAVFNRNPTKPYDYTVSAELP